MSGSALSRVAQLRTLDLATVRAAVWAGRALRGIRSRLPSEGLEVSVREPPSLPASAVRGVRVVVRAADASCLERSLILQRWLASQGSLHQLVVGASLEGDQFEAHAWIRGIDPEPDGYKVIATVPARKSA